MILPFYFLLSLIPIGLLLYISRRIQAGQPPEKAVRNLFYFLLAVFFSLLVGLLLLDYSQPSSQFAMIVIPLMMGLIPITVMHWRANPSLHTREITLILVGAIVVSVPLIYSYFQIRRDSFLPMMIFGGGVIITLTWQATRGSGFWRALAWVGLAALLAGVGINNFAQNALLIIWPGWLRALLDLASWLLPVILVTWIGYLIYALDAVPPALKPRQMLTGWVVAGIMGILLVYRLAEISLLDTMTDGLGTVMILMVASLAAIAVALLLAWRLEGRPIRTVFVYIAIMTVSISAIFTAVTRLDPQQVVVERAENINQAIQTYYQANGQYPADLNALIPRYLLYIPNPMLFRDQDWCYEGGDDFYRLGYIYRRYFGMPPERIEVKGSAGTPPAGDWVCDTQFAAFKNRAGIDFPA